MATKIWTTTSTGTASYLTAVSSSAYNGTIVGGSPHLMKKSKPSSQKSGTYLQQRARIHNYQSYKLGKMLNVLYEMQQVRSLTPESREAIHAVLTAINHLKETLKTRSDQPQAEKPVIMFYDD